MKLDSVDVLGGGPGGLFAARLIRLRFPGARVVVHEQNGLGTTFGFGVGLAAGTQRNIGTADPETHKAILAASIPLEGATFKVSRGVSSVPGDGVVGIERVALLRELRRLALEAGVEIRYGDSRRWSDLDGDLVVAADGVSSATRRELEDELGVTTDVGRGLYLWCGVDFALDTSVFESVTTEHGTFTIHAYPYAKDKSTFLVETDQDTWHAAGFDAPHQQTSQTDSDDVSLAYLADAFAETLEGRRLIGNRTRWTRFRTVTCQRWYRGNVVLLGDAAHTAHYSIGSGTKLAMEDAISLVDALGRRETIDEALRDYDGSRRPRVESLQEAATRSQAWWDSFGDRTRLPVSTLLASYLTRTGRLDLDRISTMAPGIVREALTTYAGQEPPAGDDDIAGWVLDRPFSRGRTTTSRRVVRPDDLGRATVTYVDFDHESAWSPEADTLLTDLTGHDLAIEVVWLSGSAGHGSVGTTLEFAERVKRAYPLAAVVTDSPSASRAELAAALVADRTDLVAPSQF